MSVFTRLFLNVSQKFAPQKCVLHLQKRPDRLSPSFYSTASGKEVTEVVSSTADEPDDDEIQRKRNKSRLPPELRRELFDFVPMDLKEDTKYTAESLRKRYGKFGSASGLNPGVCYPTEEEIVSMVEYEKLTHPDLFESMKVAREKKQAEEDYRTNREKQILENIEKMKIWMKDMESREAKKQKTIRNQLEKKALLIEEVQEFLGYQMDPEEPKFQDMLAKKEEEIKKAEKVAKKKEKHEKMLAQLISVGESLQKAEAAKAKPTEPAEVGGNEREKMVPSGDTEEKK